MTNQAASFLIREALSRSSRLSAVLTAVGAIAVLTGLAFSAYNLGEAQQQLASVEMQRVAVASELRSATENLKGTEAKLEQSRCALANSRSAIEAFNQRDYNTAITLYDASLKCDPDNAYLLDLNAYSHFKKGDVTGAIELELRSVKADPNYGWGYFDLARFYCARDSGRSQDALAAITKAEQLDSRMSSLMAMDGEFRRLCGNG